MTDLEGQIRYWEGVIANQRPFLNPSVEVLIRGTIQSLKELQQLKAGEK